MFLTRVLSGYCSSELGGVISIFCILLAAQLSGILSGESSSDWDLPFSIYQLPDLFVHNMPRRGQRSLSPSRSIREVRQRMSTVEDSLIKIVTNLRDVIDVPVPVVDVGDSSLHVLYALVPYKLVKGVTGGD